MEFVKAAFYSLFFVAALFIAVFNLLYSFRLNSANYRLGFNPPRFLRRALEINSIIALAGTLVLAYALVRVITSIRIPDLLQIIARLTASLVY